MTRDPRRQAPEGEERRLYPGQAIVPVVRMDARTFEPKELLGTGFFIDQRGTLMSAGHVLRVQPRADERIVVHIAPVGSGWTQPCDIANVRASDQYDLAVADVPDARNFEALEIPSYDPEGIPNLLMYDYSGGFRQDRLPTGEHGIRMIPYMWRGTWLATYVTHGPGMPGPAKIIDVPFPAMRGASGSPLVEEGTKNVVGVLFGNVARQLIPPPTLTEEGHHWYLPVGQALHCTHIRDFLQRLR